MGVAWRRAAACGARPRARIAGRLNGDWHGCCFEWVCLEPAASHATKKKAINQKQRGWREKDVKSMQSNTVRDAENGPDASPIFGEHLACLQDPLRMGKQLNCSIQVARVLQVVKSCDLRRNFRLERDRHRPANQACVLLVAAGGTRAMSCSDSRILTNGRFFAALVYIHGRARLMKARFSVAVAVCTILQRAGRDASDVVVALLQTKGQSLAWLRHPAVA
eukprot:6109512-Pleurochrysis_carterae.AAC.1